MGQYYKPMILKNDVDYPEAFMYSHDYGSGLKLMEHSWMRNPFVSTFEKEISPDGAHHGKRVVWAGDYADKENGTDEFKFPVPASEIDPEVLTWMESRKKEGREIGCNLYDYCWDKNKINPEVVNVKGKRSQYRYLVNHTKKQFVDKNKVPAVDGWRIHPLPLLTCEGNGRGGGDFRSDDESGVIGSWARNVVTAETKKPGKEYTEIKFDLTEN